MTVVGVRRAAVALALVALGGSMAALAGCGSAANVVSAADVGSAPKVVEQSLKIVNGDQPVYSPAYWTAKAGDIVVLTITSNDDGTAPLLPGSPYATVQGTVDGTELVNGKATTSLPVDQVAHTFTVPALGINLAIPAAPSRCRPPSTSPRLASTTGTATPPAAPTRTASAARWRAPV